MIIQGVGRGEKETIYGRPRCSKFQDPSLKVQGPSFQYPVPKSKFQVPSFKFQVSSFKVPVSSSKFQVPGFKFQVPSFEFQVPSFKFQVSNSKCQVSRDGLEISNFRRSLGDVGVHFGVHLGGWGCPWGGVRGGFFRLLFFRALGGGFGRRLAGKVAIIPRRGRFYTFRKARNSIKFGKPRHQNL